MAETTIVVGYDGKGSSDRALDRALAEATSSGSALVVVAVMELLFDPEGPQNFGSLDGAPAQMLPAEAPPEIEAVLERARERVEAAGATAEYVWEAGDPAGSLVGVARERNASHVVVGSHHHGMLGRFFGSDVGADIRRELGAETIVVE